MNEITSKSDTTTEFITEIRDAFKEQREALNLNVRELGAKANVSYTVIYDLESNNKLPKIETLIKLAEALDYSVTIKKAHDNDNFIIYGLKIKNDDKSKRGKNND